MTTTEQLNSVVAAATGDVLRASESSEPASSSANSTALSPASESDSPVSKDGAATLEKAGLENVDLKEKEGAAEVKTAPPPDPPHWKGWIPFYGILLDRLAY